MDHQAQSYSHELANWFVGLTMSDLPQDVIDDTRLRILDIIGLTLAGSRLGYGATAHAAALSLGGSAESTIIGFPERTGAAAAALANGLMAHSLEYDDTHNETLVHASVVSVTTGLALGEALGCSGEELLMAVAGANEIACRIGVVAPGVLLSNGYHPTGVVGTFAATYLASRLLRLDAATTRNAVGIAGSMTSGSMECWSDNTHAKAMHPGWSAHSGIAAAYLARAGLTGPSRILEGRWGFFRAHVQQPGFQPRYEKLLASLGDHWESRNLSFKPYPVGHVSHPFLDAILYLVRQEGLTADQVKDITCLIHPDWIEVVCEPREEKLNPRTAWHGRISLLYTIAEAVVLGRLDLHSYRQESLDNPEILALARRIRCVPDPDPPPRSQFKGWVVVETVDGRRLERVEPFTRGSRQNPMPPADIVQKFRENVAGSLSDEAASTVIRNVAAIESSGELGALLAVLRPGARSLRHEG